MSIQLSSELKEMVIFQATELRKRLGVNENSPVNVFAVAQNIDNLSIVRFPMKGRLSGMCVKTQTDRLIIALNSTMSLGRQNFSLAHELFHSFYDTSMVTYCGNTFESDNVIEAQADCFASFFLMPGFELLSKAEKMAAQHEDNKLSIEDLVRLEQYFGVSHKALLSRLKYSRFIDQSKYEELSNTAVMKIAQNMGYDVSLYKPLGEKQQYGTFGQYIYRANQLVNDGKISNGKYEQILLEAFRDDIVYGTDEGGKQID